MSERDYRDFIEDIRLSMRRIFEFTHEMNYSMFASDIKTQFAVIRCFEIIGEAVKRIPDEWKSGIQRFHGSCLWECETV